MSESTRQRIAVETSLFVRSWAREYRMNSGLENIPLKLPYRCKSLNISLPENLFFLRRHRVARQLGLDP